MREIENKSTIYKKTLIDFHNRVNKYMCNQYNLLK